MRGVPHKTSICRTFCAPPPLDQLLAELADRQHGVVALVQLMALGLSASAVRSRVQAGRLHRVHNGVYALGRARLTREGRWMAAVLAYGPQAVLSHRSAAALWGLRSDNRETTDVTVPAARVRSRPGVSAHGMTTLTGDDATVLHGIPCTSVARVLLDLAAESGRRGIERAVEQAELLRLFDLTEVRATMARANGHRGIGALEAVLQNAADLPSPAGSPENGFEEDFLALCRAARLPRPEAAVWLTLPDGSPIKVDFLWRREALAVECDGYEFHRGRLAFERDRRRDGELALLGIEVLRFTWRQVNREPDYVVQVVAARLGRRRGARAA